MTPKELAVRIGRGEKWTPLTESITEVKMPEPAGRICFDGGEWEEDWVSSQSAYSDDQLKQYGDDRAREALEMAAQLFEPAMTQEQAFDAVAIRELVKAIK